MLHGVKHIICWLEKACKILRWQHVYAEISVLMFAFVTWNKWAKVNSEVIFCYFYSKLQSKSDEKYDFFGHSCKKPGIPFISNLPTTHLWLESWYVMTSQCSAQNFPYTSSRPCLQTASSVCLVLHLYTFHWHLEKRLFCYLEL